MEIFSTIGLTAIIAMMSMILTPCADKKGHERFVCEQQKWIGINIGYLKPYKFGNAGKKWAGDFVIMGQGLRDIREDKNDKLIYHYDLMEVLSGYENKAWIGKCLIYLVADSKSYIVEDWGFDKGGNPLSCRSWIWP